MDWVEVAAVISVVSIALVAAIHALLNKREPSSAAGWIVVCLMFPLLGPLAYFLFGFNRIRTRARKLHTRLSKGAERVATGVAQENRSRPPVVPEELAELARISEAVSRRPLVASNRVEPLFGGEEA